jgi:hypothetical protein
VDCDSLLNSFRSEMRVEQCNGSLFHRRNSFEQEHFGRYDVPGRCIRRRNSACYGAALAVPEKEFEPPCLSFISRSEVSGCSEPQNISRFCVRDLSVGVVL